MSDHGPSRVLVVDDDIGLARLIERALLRENLTAARASTGAEAIAFLQRNQAELLLLDLKLPDFEGGALVDRLSELKLALPFVVITGQGDERVAVEMMKRGALDYVVKDAQFLYVLPTVVARALQQLDRDKRLAAAEAMSRRLESEILEISERERERIGRDLHDDLGQQLAGLSCLCRVLEKDLKAQSYPAAADAEKITQLVKDALALTRSLSRGLHPVSKHHGGLAAALNDLASRTSQVFGVRCHSKCLGSLNLDDGTANHLYRIAQEAVTNAVKHGSAKDVEIAVSSTDHQLVLSVKNDGLPIKAPSGNETGMGMRIMNYRASILRGTLTLENMPGPRGLNLTCVVPLIAGPIEEG